MGYPRHGRSSGRAVLTRVGTSPRPTDNKRSSGRFFSSSRSAAVPRRFPDGRACCRGCPEQLESFEDGAFVDFLLISAGTEVDQPMSAPACLTVYRAVEEMLRGRR